MFNPNFTDPAANLLNSRLARIIDSVRQLNCPTKQEYQAQIYSLVNKIINNGYNAAPISYIHPEVPAIIGDFTNALSVLDNDATDIIDEVLDVENSMSTFYNLTAAANNDLRQQVRQVINSSSQSKFQETFISSSQIGSMDGTLDIGAGLYSPAVTATTQLQPTVSIGSASVGTGDVTTLNSSDPTVYFAWTGNQVELVFTFSQAVALTRLTLNQHDYKDLSITSLTTTPDGSVVQDLLQELGVSFIDCGSTTNKSLGDTTIDFNPKNCLALRMVIVDNANSGSINLDSVLLYQQKFSASSVLVSQAITAPRGAVIFRAQSIFQEPYSVLSHYISYDGTSYQAISPNQTLNITSVQYWYKCVMSRNETLINQSGTFTGNGIDPSSSTYYTLQSSTTNSLGNNIIEKNLLFSSVNGPITIDDPIIPNTFYVQQGSTILSNTNYMLTNGVLTFASAYSNITVVYQTVADVSSVSSLLSFFAARLVGYSFEVV